RVAFSGDVPPDAGADVRELKPLFEAITSAHKRRNQSAMGDEIDGERFADEGLDSGLLGSLSFRQRITFRAGLTSGMAEGLTPGPGEATWDLFDIRRVRKLSPDEAVAVVVHRPKSGHSEKVRWWVIRRSGRWKAYDYEYLNTGIRNSVISAILL